MKTSIKKINKVIKENDVQEMVNIILNDYTEELGSSLYIKIPTNKEYDKMWSVYEDLFNLDNVKHFYVHSSELTKNRDKLVLLNVKGIQLRSKEFLEKWYGNRS